MTKLFKNSKSILSFVLAFAVLAVSLFTGIVASAADPVVTAEGIVDLLEFGSYLTDAGSSSQYYDTVVADNGETGASWDDPIIIDSAEEFVYIAKTATNDTAGKYYKVADGIAGFDLSKGNLDLGGTLADNLANVQGSGKNHAGGTPGFQGHFDGNGVTVYGAWTNHTEGNVPTYAGLFSCTQGDVTIKNVNVKFASFTASAAVGGIVGYHKGDGTNTLTIENCSITDSHLEYTGAGNFGHGIGAILGYSANLSSWKEADKGVDGNGDGDMLDTIYINGAVNIKNCYVNLDENYFISCLKPGDADVRGCHGGIAGFINTNAMSVSDCVVIGITPYATSASTSFNDVQHSGLESRFTNIYTTDDVAITDVALGGTLAARDFTGKVFPLRDAQLKGAAAVENMDLDWSVWMADADGYPELANAHKNVTLVDNENGTHAATCACGFGGIAVDCTYVDGTCACGAELNCATRKTIYWDGTEATGIATGTGTKDDPYIIKSAAEFAWLIKQKADVTSNKYYEIDEAIGKIVLQPESMAAGILALDSAAAVKTYFEANAASAKTWPFVAWEGSCFAGQFDGNGVTVYGLYQVSTSNAGLFSTIDGGAAIKNIALKNSYLTSTATNYQVGGIAAVTSSPTYGAQRNGAIWFEGCVVANNYMYNLCTSQERSGVIMGSSSDVVYIDNCLVYGNDATYGEAVAMPIWANGNNSVIVSDSFVAPDGLELVNDGAETEPRYYNMVRNSVIFGAKPYNAPRGKGSRFNDPKCFINVLTDADVATDTFGGTEATLGATDEQIKTVTLADLATIELPEAFIATETYPELRSFHDEVFTGAPSAADNYAGHVLSCSCGLTTSVEKHSFVITGEGLGAECKCSVCGFICLHEYAQLTPVDGDCLTASYYHGVCDCGLEADIPLGEAAGHTFTDVAETPSTCQTNGVAAHKYCTACEKNYATDAGKMAAFDTALTDEDLKLALGDHTPATDDSGTVYASHDGKHYNVCAVCSTEYNGEACTGNYVADGAKGHSGACSVCLAATAGLEAHVFGDDSKCDTCGWECTAHTYADGEETILLYEGEATPDACKKVEQICSVCGTKGEDKVVGHEAGDWQTPWMDRNYVAPCVTDGQHTESQYCDVCFLELDSKIVTDPKTGHQFVEYEEVAPTCTTLGTIAHKQCEVCWNCYDVDAANDEPYENALDQWSGEMDIPVDADAHIWVEYGEDATCEEDGVVAHKFCLDCMTFVVDGEETDVEIDWDAFWAYDEETYEPIGIGAKLNDAYNEIENEAFAKFIAENYADEGIEVPAYPEDDSDWDVMNAYYEEYYAIWATLAEVDETWQEAWGEYWMAYWSEVQTEAYYEALLLAAEEAEIDLVAPAIGHDIVKVDEVAATYDKEGTKAHYACECGKLFSDAEGTIEVTAESLVIAKLVKEEDKTSTENNKTEGDSSSKSPATGESVAAVAAVAALMGAAFVLVRKARKA